MSTLAKKIIYTTIGAASVTNEKLKELVEDLIQNNQFTEEEGKRIIDSFLVECSDNVDTLNTSLRVRVDDFLKKFGIPSVHSVKQDLGNYLRDVKDNPATLLRLPSKR
jgi:polyhydroxyalkanoate synthesis regulator phasin